MPEALAALPPDLRPAAESLFGSGLDLAEAYADLLATEGVTRGLIGPREAPRIWDRHILNCGAMATLLTSGDFVVDVGSGAGLPGIVLGIARPDVTVALVEPLARRTTFLVEVVSDLGLGNRVSVVRGRAEEVAAQPAMFHVKPADVVTARAVAPLDRLAGWCLPLCAMGGRFLAIKGSSAAGEVTEHAAAIGLIGGGAPRIRLCEIEGLDPTVVVEVVRERVPAHRSGTRQRSEGRSRRD